MIDVHCHLENEVFNVNLPEIIKKSEEVGLSHIITSSVSSDEWEKSKAISNTYKIVEHALGIHPWFATLLELKNIDNLYNVITDKTIAIGEIGLDRKIETPDFITQQMLFEKQLKIACEKNLPVIIHCRGAFQETLDSIKRVGLPDARGFIHAFSGSREIAELFIKEGLLFSMGGSLTYKSGKKRIRTLELIYPDYFLIETDSPDFLPVNLDETFNVPSNIIHNINALSKMVDIPVNEITKRITANAKNLFNLK